METFKNILQWVIALAILAFWLWACENNHGLFAIGIPVLVVIYAASTSDSKGSGSNEPRGGPWDGDGG